MNTHTTKRAARGAVFVLCTAAAFVLGFRSASDVRPVQSSIAQSSGTTDVIVTLQYEPLGGGAPKPIEVTQFMNSSQTAIVQFRRVQDGIVYPGNHADRCRTTSSAGRCTVRNLRSGSYDVIPHLVFIEDLTGIPLVQEPSAIVFDIAEPPTAEQRLTITLRERDTCRKTAPPESFCGGDGRLVSFVCNPSTPEQTKPWEKDFAVCPAATCPDGNTPQGVCDEVVPGLAACSAAAACGGNLRCDIRGVGSRVTYEAGTDTVVITGERFAEGGGFVRFPAGGGEEIVRIPTGSDWSDTEIRVRVPLNAVSGKLAVHPNSHGEIGGDPVVCTSPAVSIHAFADQFSILSINATTPSRVQLVSPGFATTFTLLARHNDNVGRFDQIAVELVEGAFPDPDDLPLSRTVIAQHRCPVEIIGSSAVREATLRCLVPVPDAASAFEGPFTFIVTLSDDRGGAETAVLLGSDRSALAGDFTLDGFLTISDAVLGRRLALGMEPVLPAHRERDTNGDGEIDMADAQFVLHSLTQ